MLTQPAIPNRVMAALIFTFMRTAIQLHDEPEFDAEKIRDVIPDRDLPPEFQTVEPRIA